MKLDFCCACGSKDNLEFHHLIPKSEGGSDDDKNLLTICYLCHGKIHGILRRDIRKLTIDGLLKAKNRGVKLGSPNPKFAAKFAAIALAKKADAFSSTLEVFVASLLKVNARLTLREICGIFLNKNIKTPRGSENWNASQVKNLLNRLGYVKEQSGWIKISQKAK